MRKFLLIALACAPIFLLAQAERIALIEHFTNASCVPCAAQNPDFNALIRANPDKVISVKYQASFPGFDPMNAQNPSEVMTRGDYYGLEGVPTAWVDGVLPDNDYGGGVGAWNITPESGYAGGPYGYNQAALDFASDQTTPISMMLTHEINEDVTEVTVTVAITNESSEDFTMTDGRLQVALVERDIRFPGPPGSNGEIEFEDVMRKMYPDAEGTSMMTIAAGETWETTITGDIPDYVYGLNELRVIAFVQDHATTEVWQAAYTEPAEVNGVDAAVGDNLTAAPIGTCGATITPIVQLENRGGVDITQAVIAVSVNDNVLETFDFDGMLAPGESTDIEFSEIVLTETNNALAFSVLEANNGMGLNLNTLNDNSAPTNYNALSETPIGTDLEETNEDYVLTYPETALATPGIPLGDFGGNSFIVFARNELTTTAGDPVGGYGASERSILVNFYQWDPNNPATPSGEGQLTYQKIDLTNATEASLSFDRASASFSGDGVSSDRLQVRISTDCAETFDVIWDAQGAELIQPQLRIHSTFLVQQIGQQKSLI